VNGIAKEWLLARLPGTSVLRTLSGAPSASGSDLVTKLHRYSTRTHKGMLDY
jgi:hypothetical protein